MLEPQILDDLERKVSIAELQARTIQTARHADPLTLTMMERLARSIVNSLREHRADSRSVAISSLFALKVRMSAALDQVRQVTAR